MVFSTIRMDHNEGNAELHVYVLSKRMIMAARSGWCLPHTSLCHLLMTQNQRGGNILQMILVLNCYTGDGNVKWRWLRAFTFIPQGNWHLSETCY